MALAGSDAICPDMDILKILRIQLAIILMILLIIGYGFTMNAGPHATEFPHPIVRYEHLPDEIFANYIPMFYPTIPPYYDGLHDLVRLYRRSRRAFLEEIDRLNELL